MSAVNYSINSENNFEIVPDKIIGAVQNFCGRMIKLISKEETPPSGETEPKDKLVEHQVDSLSKPFFESADDQEIVKPSSPLAQVYAQPNHNISDQSFEIQPHVQTKSLPEGETTHDDDFSFVREISKIDRNDSVTDQDVELGRRFYKEVNPTKIFDGHCASCAFNTHLHLTGKPLEEGREPNGSFQEFGNWFYPKFGVEFSEETTIESRENETYGEMRGRVEQKVKELTRAGEAVLISVSEGTHWFNAYNDGTRVWFIDSQTGKGFNLYDDDSGTVKPSDIIDSEIGEEINIVRVSSEDISEYSSRRKSWAFG